MRDRYLVGMLAPQRQRVLPEEQDELAVGGTDRTEDGAADATTTQAPTIFPSSFGFTCCIDGDVTEAVIGAHWGRYERTKSQTLTTAKTDEPQTVWQRVLMGSAGQRVPLRVGPIKRWTPDADQPEVYVKGLVRRSNDVWIVTLFLVNGQHEPEKLRDTAWIFQPELTIAAPDGTAIFRQRTGLRSPTNTDAVIAAEDDAMQMLYRQEVEFAVGHGVSVHADVDPADPTHASRILTRVVPSYEVPRTVSPSASDIPALAHVVVDMAILAQTPNGRWGAALMPLVDAYAVWIAQQTVHAADDADLGDFQSAARDVLAQCKEALERIRAGIALLDHNPQAAQAFRFANAAMWQQRVHTLAAEAARRGQAPDMSLIDVLPNRSWQLFQLTFILINLPALTDLHHAERSSEPSAVADLLWFPTRGGKTEAYLGLTAYTLAIRRLQGNVNGRSGMEGVAVLMRYTLRLLTLQQFQRAAALICACEMIRRNAPRARRRHGGCNTVSARIVGWPTHHAQHH